MENSQIEMMRIKATRNANILLDRFGVVYQDELNTEDTNVLSKGKTLLLNLSVFEDI